MKSPNQWWKEWHKDGAMDIEMLVERVQQEAYHEGQLAGVELGRQTAMKAIAEVFKGSPESKIEETMKG